MRGKTNAQLEREYPDVLDACDFPGDVQLVRDLDAGFHSVALPPSLFRPPERVGRPLNRREVARETPRRRWSQGFVAATATLLAVASLVIGSLAAGKPPKILNLGKPTNDVSPTGWVSLDDFHRIKTNLRAGKKPEVLFVDWLGDTNGDAERWPLVKALEQFGSLSHVSTLPGGPGERIAGHTLYSGATFNLTHARYHSKYLSFADREIAILASSSTSAQVYYPYQKLSGTALKLYKRYAKPHVTAEYTNGGGPRIHQAKIPMVVVGNYLAVQPGFAGRYDLFSTVTSTPVCGYCYGEPVPFSFSTIHDALLHDKSPATRPTLVTDMNAEANVITALICHADGKKPASVCGRPVIKKLMKLAK